METPYIAHILAKKDILQKAPQNLILDLIN